MNQGVELFFCISGFVMYVSVAGRPKGPRAALTFIKRRLIRVVPLYWLFLSLYLFEVYPAIRGGRGVIPDWRFVVTSYLFGFRKMSGNGFSGDGVQIHWPLLTVGWTLTFKLFFYLCFAFTLYIKRSPFWIAPLLITMVLVGPYSRASWPAMAALLSPRLLCFLAGMAIARYVPRRFVIPPLAAVVGCLLFVSCVFHYRDPATPSQYWLLTLCSAILIVSAISLERFGYIFKRGLLITLGDASYSLYLSHLLLLHVDASVLRYHALTHVGTVMLAWVSGGVCCGVAILIHRYIELPMLNGLNRTIGGHRHQLLSS